MGLVRWCVVFVLVSHVLSTVNAQVINWNCLSGDSPESCAALIDKPSTYTQRHPLLGSRGEFGCTWASPSDPALTWLYGGVGYMEDGEPLVHADMWQFNSTATAWTFVGPNMGANGTIQPSYGPKFVNASRFHPGSRSMSVCFALDDTLYMFGGTNANGTIYGDLWTYTDSMRQWVFVSGSNQPNSLGKRGAPGQSSVSFYPSARTGAAYWQLPAAPEIAWLFGGETAEGGLTADVWLLNLAWLEWSWIAGSPQVNAPAIYHGQNASPGARTNHVVWVFANDGDYSTDYSTYMFGGFGYGDDNVTRAALNDLWMFDFAGSNWTFLAGCQSLINECCNGHEYYPSCRYGHVAVAAYAYPSVWLYGGVNAAGEMLSELWEIDVSLGYACGWRDNRSWPLPRTGALIMHTDSSALLMYGGVARASPLQVLGDVWRLSACGYGCLECGNFGNQTCLVCDTPLVLSAGACLTACPNGTFNVSGACTGQCAEGCAICTGEGLEVSVCQSCNAQIGYLLNINGSACVSGCTPGEYRGPTQCAVCSLGCSICQGPGLTVPPCMACDASAGYLLSHNGTHTHCVTSCGKAEYNNSVQCFPCSMGCSSCVSHGLAVPTECLACNELAGYVLSANTSECVTTCSAGQYLSEGACYDCSEGCASCRASGLALPDPCTACNSTAGYSESRAGDQCVFDCPPFQKAVDGRCDYQWSLIGAIAGGGAALLACLCAFLCCDRCCKDKDEPSGGTRPLTLMTDSTIPADTRRLLNLKYVEASKTINIASINDVDLLDSLATTTIKVTIPVFSADDLEILAPLSDEAGDASHEDEEVDPAVEERQRLALTAADSGSAYKVRNRRSGLLMALKVFRDIIAPSQVENFLRDSTTMIGLRHNACLRYVGVLINTQDGKRELGIISEYAAGGDLGSLGEVSLAEKVSILMKVAQGLCYLHDNEIVYYDLTPSNILLDGRGGVLLSDFGLIGLRNYKPATPQYASPEVKKRGIATFASDMYSFGAIAQELLYPPRATSKPVVPEDVNYMVQLCLREAARSRPTSEQVIELLLRHT